MADFFAFVSALDYDSAQFAAYFEGGDPAYQNHRNVEVRIYDAGTLVRVQDFLSVQASGGDNSFSGIISPLAAGKAYTWDAVLQYYDAQGWHDTSYISSGSFSLPEPPPPPPTHEVQAWVYDGGWKRAEPWVYSGGWKKAEPWVYSGEWRVKS